MINESNIQRLKEASEEIFGRCYWRAYPYGLFPSKPGDGGDDCLWLGLLSSVHFADAAIALSQCQAGPNELRAGMFYRNPLRRFNDNDGFESYFSRDMATGVLLYYASGWGNSDTSGSWQKYFESQKYCITKRPWPFKGCLLYGYKFSPDNRSDITPKIFALLGRVWKHRVWPVSSEMKKWAGTDGDYDVIESKACPIGYQLHLHCIDAYIKRIIGQSREYAERVAGICYGRAPDNLFYKIISQWDASDQDASEFFRLYNMAPKGAFGDGWLWEKDGIDSHAPNACGWDLYFMAKLLLKLA